MNDEIKTILISPHSDDIAYSIGGALLHNFFKRPILMLTVFTKSNYSPSIKMSNSEIISKVRCLEDVEFADKLQIKLQSFNFSEPPLRGYSHKEMFTSNHNSDPVYTEVYFALSKLIKLYQCELIVSPMGLGNHVDHINLSNICNRIAKENNLQIVFYEDLHYASHLTLKRIKERANTISPNLQYYNINITPKFYNKLENVELYKTQASRASNIMIKLHALRLGMENKSLKEKSYDIFKNLLFLFSLRHVQVPLYERIWINKKGGE